MESLAVECNRVCKKYARRGKNILKNASLHVPTKHIYALLGPSGCGKTTLLKCVVGRLGPSSGTVKVFNYAPADHGRRDMGLLVGFMPQEFALHYQLTIANTMFFFGRIYGMTNEQITERMHFLLRFLELPEENRMVMMCSGGQQRRISFAVALLNSPPLVILDEPTVGVDPILREKIWEHLVDLVKTTNTTVIITTHYIDEARNANTVGFMRDGHVLAEGPPADIMQRFNADSLETAFVALCKMQDKRSGTITSYGDLPDEDNTKGPLPMPEPDTDIQLVVVRKSVDMGINNGGLDSGAVSMSDLQSRPSVSSTSLVFSEPPKKPVVCLGINWANVTAIMIRNLTIMSRRLGFVMFQFLLPAIQIALFCWCVGGQPAGLRVGLVNDDLGTNGYFFSTNVTSNIDSNAITLVAKNSIQQASEGIATSDTLGTIYFPQNFTEVVLMRILGEARNATNTTIKQSEINLHLDYTNLQVALVIEQQVQNAFTTSLSTAVKNYGDQVDPSIVEPFFDYIPAYGSPTAPNTIFMAPGVMTSIPYFLAIGLTAMSFVSEAKAGILDRSMVAGINTAELTIALTSVQLGIMLVQVAILILITTLGFYIPFVGSIALSVLIIILNGMSAMGLGLLISASVTEEVSAIQLSLGTVYPVQLLSGIWWPLEAMPEWIRVFSYMIPMSHASEAVRSLMGRGWNITQSHVWLGLIVPFAWIIATFGLALLIMHRKNK